jgi:hypothetical protein
MDLFRHAIVLCSTVLALSALSGCAVRPLVLNHVADALAMPGQDLEDDILLAREASAFYLKLSESVLRETPGNLKLAESVSSGFTQYAYAFVSFEADQLQSKDAKAAQRMKQRAARLYARAHGHAMRALEKTTPGFTKALMQAEPSASLRLSDAQVGVAYWAAASWGGMISLSKDDPDKVADLPAAMRLAKLAWETQPDHGRGSLSSLMGTLLREPLKRMYDALRLKRTSWSCITACLTENRFWMAACVWALSFRTSAIWPSGPGCHGPLCARLCASWRWKV